MTLQERSGEVSGNDGRDKETGRLGDWETGSHSQSHRLDKMGSSRTVVL